MKLTNGSLQQGASQAIGVESSRYLRAVMVQHLGSLKSKFSASIDA
jgi:hypothetical protein